MGDRLCAIYALNMSSSSSIAHSMTIKEDLLKCCTAELSYGLCKFISEVRRPNGEKYSPDSVFYLCLGIQQVKQEEITQTQHIQSCCI